MAVSVLSIVWHHWVVRETLARPLGCSLPSHSDTEEGAVSEQVACMASPIKRSTAFQWDRDGQIKGESVQKWHKRKGKCVEIKHS